MTNIFRRKKEIIKKPSDKKDNKTEEEKKNSSKLKIWWTELNKMEKTQVCLIGCNILMIIAFSVIGTCQNTNTSKSLNITDSTLQEIKRNNVFQENITRIGTRAWVSVVEAKIISKLSDSIAIEARIQNVGRSPAYNVYECASLLPFHEDDLNKAYIDNKGIAERHKKGGYTLAPGMSFPRVFHFGKWGFKILENLMNTNNLYIIGRVVYEDIFKEEHFLSFCYWYDSASKKFLMYDRYNETDTLLTSF